VSRSDQAAYAIHSSRSSSCSAVYQTTRQIADLRTCRYANVYGPAPKIPQTAKRREIAIFFGLVLAGAARPVNRPQKLRADTGCVRPTYVYVDRRRAP